MAIKSESNTTINGGDLRLAVSGEASKGIKSGGHVVITGGTLDITTTGNAFYESNDISSAAGIKCDGSFKITNPGTTLTITSSGSAGKGINCDGTLTIENCTVNVTTTVNLIYTVVWTPRPKVLKAMEISRLEVVTSLLKQPGARIAKV